MLKKKVKKKSMLLKLNVNISTPTYVNQISISQTFLYLHVFYGKV